MNSVNDVTRCLHRPDVSRQGYASLAVSVERASTIPFPSGEAYAQRKQRGPDGYSYGLAGTPTTRVLEAQIAALEGADRAVLTPSGLSAVTLAMLACLRPGDRVLIPDTVYPPVRDFASGHLGPFGVTVAYYDPTLGAGINALMDDRTRLVWVESPGSSTFEVQDLPAIASAAHVRGALVGCDNSWATPLFHKPLRLGADLVVEALTKFISGHSDVLMGSIAAHDPAIHDRIRATAKTLGIGVSPDDCALVLRGIETLPVRLARSASTGAELMEFLAARPEIETILHPSRPDAVGGCFWSRDFRGAPGVFGATFRQPYADRITPALAALRLFAIGASWGGTRSLVAPMPIAPFRTATRWQGSEPVLRISAGLEDPEDLLADLEAFLRALHAAPSSQELATGEPAMVADAERRRLK